MHLARKGKEELRALEMESTLRGGYATQGFNLIVQSRLTSHKRLSATDLYKLAKWAKII